MSKPKSKFISTEWLRIVYQAKFKNKSNDWELNYADIDLILTKTPYFMLLSYNSDMINMVTSYIKYYTQ